MDDKNNEEYLLDDDNENINSETLVSDGESASSGTKFVDNNSEDLLTETLSNDYDLDISMPSFNYQSNNLISKSKKIYDDTENINEDKDKQQDSNSEKQSDEQKEKHQKHNKFNNNEKLNNPITQPNLKRNENPNNKQLKRREKLINFNKNKLISNSNEVSKDNNEATSKSSLGEKNKIEKDNQLKQQNSNNSGKVLSKLNDLKQGKKKSKIVKEASKNKIKKITTAKIMSLLVNPLFWIILGVIIVAIALIFIMAVLISSYGGGSGSGSGGLLATYSNCDYITVEGVGPIEFEKYVAGVVTAENGDPAFPEAMKAQAVAARTYALAVSNYCSEPIGNGENVQVYKEPSEAGILAAKETESEVMLDTNGKAIQTNYSSYPDGGEHNWSYGKCDVPICDDTTCTVSMYKIPTGEKFEFKMDKYNDGNLWNGLELTNQGGHCYGMSQVGARYLEKNGFDYTEILQTFYAYEPASMKTGFGAIIGSILYGYEPRVTKPTASDSEWTNENIFYTSNNKLVGQCTWYAHGRALEILKNSGLKGEELNKAIGILRRIRGDAGQWFEANKKLGGNGFAYGDEPKLGAIVVWGGVSKEYGASHCPGNRYPECGHVGIVEQVNKNPLTGEVVSLRISDGYKEGSGTSWDTVRFQYRERSIEYVQSYSNGCRNLIGYIYLVE